MPTVPLELWQALNREYERVAIALSKTTSKLDEFVKANSNLAANNCNLQEEIDALRRNA